MAADDLLLAVEWPDGRTVAVRIEFKQPLDTAGFELTDAPVPAEEPALVGLSPAHLASKKALVAYLRRATRALAGASTRVSWRSASPSSRQAP